MADNIAVTAGSGTTISADDIGSGVLAQNVKLMNGEGGSAAPIGALDDSAMPATPAVLPVGAEYRATPTTYADGDATVLQSDTNGNAKVTQATLLAGEDLVNNVLKTEQRFTGTLATADASIKGSAGFLHTLTFSCNDAAPTAGSIIVYDNTAESGTQLFNHTFTTTPFLPFSVTLDVSFATGCYIGFTTTNDVNVTASWR